MESPDLSISVGDLIGVPKVTMRGVMDGWHDQAVSGVLTSFRDQGTTSLVLDLASLSFTGIDGAASLINVLRGLGPELRIHVVASAAISSILAKAALGPCVRLYSSTDEIAEYLPTRNEFLTSRWIAAKSEDGEMPLAA